jgi:hypothetical protein
MKISQGFVLHSMVLLTIIGLVVFIGLVISTEIMERRQGTQELRLVVLTNRTALHQDGSLAEMTISFEQAYNCTVEYRSYTNYTLEVSALIHTKNYGDVLMIPNTLIAADLETFLEPLGNYTKLSKKYFWTDEKMYSGIVYGLAGMGMVSGGICYNKHLFSAAGITEIPKSPEAFLEALQKIKDVFPNVIPFCTNYNTPWAIVQWQDMAHSISGNPQYALDMLIFKTDLFQENGPYYRAYKFLFDLYSNPNLHEPEPLISDWEQSKAAINHGQIATMVIPAWAVPDCKAAGPNPDAIGYMPAPFTIRGTQFSEIKLDYCLGINKYSSRAVKELAGKYLVWFVEQSGFAQKEGGVSALHGGRLPDYLEDFKEVELFNKSAAPVALAGVFDAIANESGLDPSGHGSGNFTLQIAEAAFAGKPFNAVESIFAGGIPNGLQPGMPMKL